MKEWRTWAIGILIISALFFLFQSCEKDKKIDSLTSTNSNEQFLRDINLLESKIKDKERSISVGRHYQDSILTINKELVKREENRVKISTIKPTKTLKVTEDFKATFQDTGEYVSDDDYDSLKVIGNEVQEDLSKALGINSELDSTIRSERLSQAAKDTSTQAIISMQQGELIEKEKERQKVQKKLRVAKFFLKAGAVAIAVLSVIVFVK